MYTYNCPACGSRHFDRLGADRPPKLICEICCHVWSVSGASEPPEILSPALSTNSQDTPSLEQ